MKNKTRWLVHYKLHIMNNSVNLPGQSTVSILSMNSSATRSAKRLMPITLPSLWQAMLFRLSFSSICSNMSPIPMALTSTLGSLLTCIGSHKHNRWDKNYPFHKKWISNRSPSSTCRGRWANCRHLWGQNVRQWWRRQWRWLSLCGCPWSGCRRRTSEQTAWTYLLQSTPNSLLHPEQWRRHYESCLLWCITWHHHHYFYKGVSGCLSTALFYKKNDGNMCWGEIMGCNDTQWFVESLFKVSTWSFCQLLPWFFWNETNKSVLLNRTWN